MSADQSHEEDIRLRCLRRIFVNSFHFCFPFPLGLLRREISEASGIKAILKPKHKGSYNGKNAECSG
jgi:hypothetical protein